MRWLLANGKKDKAVKILKKVANVNGVDMSKQDILDVLGTEFESKPEIEAEGTPKASFFDLFKHPVILKRSIIVMLLW